jgi:hypothetical protein
MSVTRVPRTAPRCLLYNLNQEAHSLVFTPVKKLNTAGPQYLFALRGRFNECSSIVISYKLLKNMEPVFCQLPKT